MSLTYLLSKIVCNGAGFLYPAYGSYKAIKAKDAHALTRWLTYWIVMGLFTAGEFVADMFVFWLPFYYELKALFVLWLILPQTRGSSYLYRTIIHPTLTKHEAEIDKRITRVQEQAKKTGVAYGRRVALAAKAVMIQSLARAPELLDGAQPQQPQPQSSSSANPRGTFNASGLTASTIQRLTTLSAYLSTTLLAPPSPPSSSSPVGSTAAAMTLVSSNTTSLDVKRLAIRKMLQEIEEEEARVSKTRASSFSSSGPVDTPSPSSSLSSSSFSSASSLNEPPTRRLSISKVATGVVDSVRGVTSYLIGSSSTPVAASSGKTKVKIKADVAGKGGERGRTSVVTGSGSGMKTVVPKRSSSVLRSLSPTSPTLISPPPHSSSSSTPQTSAYTTTTSSSPATVTAKTLQSHLQPLQTFNSGDIAEWDWGSIGDDEIDSLTANNNNIIKKVK